jgi:peptide/nickel transport system substrate-binding protein
MSTYAFRACTGILLVLAVIAAGCRPSQQQARDAGAGAAPEAAAPAKAPKQGGTLTLSLQKDITTLNPLVATKSTDHVVRDLMFESLLNIDDRGNIQPKLAERWEVSPDGKIYTFHLRRGVKFHTGQEMTAADAKFSLDWSLNPRNGAYGTSKLALVERSEVGDSHTLRMYLKQPSPTFLYGLISIQSFPIVPEGSVPEGLDKLPTFPAGTGPFKFVEWQTKQRTVVERFDDYWGQKAYLDRVVFKPIEDSSVRFTALRAGDVDMIDRAPYEWVREILDGKIKGLAFAEAPTADFRAVTFNMAAPPFDNKELRRAFGYALDKKELLEAAYYGFGNQGDQKYPKGHAWYFEGVPFPSYDPDKARAALQAAGYTGQPITLILEQSKEIQAAGAAIQAQLKKVGINVVFDLVDYSTYVERQRRGEYSFKWSGGSFDADPWGTYGPDFTCEADRSKRAENNSGHCDPELDALMERGKTELNQERRRETFRQILNKLADDLPQINVGFVPRYYVFGDFVKGFSTDGEGHIMHHGGGINFVWLDK